MSARRGFTLLELAVSLTVAAALVPATYMAWRSYEAQQLRALGRVEAARSMRTITEELRRDLRTLRFADGTTLRGDGPCEEVDYRVRDDGVLERAGRGACGLARGLARNVQSIERDGDTIVVTFARRIRGTEAFTTSFVLGLPPRSNP